ncbi:chemotaxis protein CheW [Qipengyuania sp. MTN3-11]|uniref:chemotaxis protein CheW n=1 Tax=Qipengyuania sp. MTN3-11 TaxID=3056557 RepID=UPI0036F279F7
MSQLLLMCWIAGRRVAVPALRVRSVIDVDTIIPIPRSPDHVVGLTALRSQVLTVIDCRSSLGFGPAGEISGMRAAVVEQEGHAYALLLEDASDVEEAETEPEILPGGFGEIWNRVAEGMVETATGPALVVAIEKLIAGPMKAAA